MENENKKSDREIKRKLVKNGYKKLAKYNIKIKINF
jgi:hypothetical protein